MERKNAWKAYSKNDEKKLNELCEGYKDYLFKGKTEREGTAYMVKKAEEAGYVSLESVIEKKKKLKAGDKVYAVCMGKTVALFNIGKKSLEEGMNILGAHLDSPRLDVKQNPLYEKNDLAYLDTHYYGGIKKYQWVTLPLAIHGVVVKTDGTKVDVVIGEDEDDPVFCVTDILIHLAQEQMVKKANVAVEGENLDLLIASRPIKVSKDDKKKEKELVKKQVLEILKKKYDMEEEDFMSAELEIVPAGKPRDMGLDKSMILAYGQDDKVCAYPSLMAEIENINPDKTSVAVFTDKEEIGSEGNTGMVSEYLFQVMEDLADIANVKTRDVYRNSLCLSSDVNSAYDPSFADAFEKRNASHINHGVVLTKYTGHAGKSGSNDASAETMAKIIKLMEDKNVVWQIGELGKVDIGGGGTIAKYVSQRNIDTIDVGVAVLSMHSPYELTSKLDIYHTYLAYKAFLYNK